MSLSNFRSLSSTSTPTWNPTIHVIIQSVEVVEVSTYSTSSYFILIKDFLLPSHTATVECWLSRTHRGVEGDSARKERICVWQIEAKTRWPPGLQYLRLQGPHNLATTEPRCESLENSLYPDDHLYHLLTSWIRETKFAWLENFAAHEIVPKSRGDKEIIETKERGWNKICLDLKSARFKRG